MNTAGRSLKRIVRGIDHTYLTFVAVVAVGFGMVIAGWVIQGSDYVPGLLLQVGSSVDLVAPLFLLNRYVERRMRRAELNTEQVAASMRAVRDGLERTSLRLDEISVRIRGGSQGHLDGVLSVASLLTRQVSRDLVAEAVAQAVAAGVVSPAGIRVRLAESDHRLRINAAGPIGAAEPERDVTVSLEDVGGRRIVPIAWHATKGPVALVAGLADALEAEHDHLGAANLDAAALFTRLSRDLITAVDLVRRPAAPVTGGVIEVVNDQWVIAENGLAAIEQPYLIPRLQLTDPHGDWAQHLATKAWVDPAKSREALRTAKALLTTQR